MATAQQLTARARRVALAVAGFGERSRRRVNGAASAFPTRGDRRIASPANPFTFRRGLRTRAVGGCRYDGPHQGIPRHATARTDRASSSISTSCAKTISASPRRCRTRACSTPSRPIPRRRSSTLLADLGSCFDTASIAEIELALAAGATPDRVSFGNTIKKERDIARAYALGVRLFAVDCEAEVEKVARAAPGAKVFCRILCDGAGAEWPLSRKFGCAPEMAARVLERAHRARPRRARAVVPRRLAAAQPAHVGPAR